MDQGPKNGSLLILKDFLNKLWICNIITEMMHNSFLCCKTVVLKISIQLDVIFESVGLHIVTIINLSLLLLLLLEIKQSNIL